MRRRVDFFGKELPQDAVSASFGFQVRRGKFQIRRYAEDRVFQGFLELVQKGQVRDAQHLPTRACPVKGHVRVVFLQVGLQGVAAVADGLAVDAFFFWDSFFLKKVLGF